MVVQKARGLFDVYEGFAFLLVHSLMRSGVFLWADIPAKDEPSRDSSRTRNNAILRTLPRPFCAAFRGGYGDSDGFLEWSAPVDVRVPDADNFGWCRIPARRLPLEVGYTTASRTLMHLIEDRGLARWPYGCRVIRVFVPRADCGATPMGDKRAEGQSPFWPLGSAGHGGGDG